MQNVSNFSPPFSGLPPFNVALFEAKARRGLSFDQIAKQIGKDEIWVAAAFYGQVIQDTITDHHRSLILV